MGKGGFYTMSPSGPPGQFDETKLAHCISRSCILQNKTTIGPLRHILRKIFFDKVPLWGPRGSGLDMPTKCDHKLVSAVFSYGGDRGTRYSLRTDGRSDCWTAGRRTKGYRIISPGLRPVELKCF